jgi:hypothetical protein
MIAVPDILPLIDRVVAMRQADAVTIARLLGGRPRVQAQQPNPYYVIWQAAGTAPVRRVELRMPKKRGSPRLIVIDIDTRSTCVDRRRVRARYGEAADLLPPSPHQPAGSPAYQVYRKPWGDLRIGFDQRRCAVSVVIDATI